MIGGMVSSTVLTLVVIPAIYGLVPCHSDYDSLTGWSRAAVGLG